MGRKRGGFISVLLLSSIEICCSGAGSAQILPSESLQQQIQEERLRQQIDTLERRDEKDAAPLVLPGQEFVIPSSEFVLRGLRLEGVRHENAADLEAFLVGWIGRAMDQVSLQQLRQSILRWYSERDQLVVVTFSALDAEHGVLTIQVTEALLGAVAVDGRLQHHLNNALAMRYVTASVPLGSVIRPGKLESAILKLNDLAGISVRARLVAGTLPGTSDLILEIEDTDRHRLVLDVDNYLNRFSGSLRTALLAEGANPFGRGARFWVLPSWWGNAQGTGTAPVSAGLEMPLSADGLSMSASANYGEYRLLDSFYDDNINGSTFAGQASVIQPLWRRRDRSLFVQIGGGYYAFNDNLASLQIDNKQAGVGRLSLIGMNRDNWFGVAVNTLVLGISAGSVDLSGNQIYQAFDALTANVQGGYVKGSLLYLRQQQFDQRWGARLQLIGQVAGENLDGFEQCGLGWPNGVRAYPPGEASSSNCLVGQLDLNVQLNEWLTLVGFVDGGLGQRWVDPFPGALTPNGYGLAGGGVGFDLGRPQQWMVNLRAAFPFGANTLNDNGLDVDGFDPAARVWAGLRLWL